MVPSIPGVKAAGLQKADIHGISTNISSNSNSISISIASSRATLLMLAPTLATSLVAPTATTEQSQRQLVRLHRTCTVLLA